MPRMYLYSPFIPDPEGIGVFWRRSDKRVNVRFSSSELISESSHRCTEGIESRIEIPIFSGRAFVGNWTDECRFFYPIIDIVESLEVGRGRVQKAYESVGVALLKVGDPNAEFYFGDGPNPLDDMLISPVRPYGNRVGLNLTGSGTLIVVDEGALMNHLNNGGNLPLSGEVIELPVGIYRFESFSDPMARGALSWRITKSA